MSYHLKLLKSLTFDALECSYIVDIWGKSDSNTSSSSSSSSSSHKNNLIKNDHAFISKYYRSNQVKFLNQTHGVDFLHLPVKSDSLIFWGDADSAYTSELELPVIIRTADCIPILFWSLKEKFCGGIHAGWRGLHKDILKNVINVLERRNLKGSRNDLFFLVGPFITKESYEVERDTFEKFEEDFSYDFGKPGKKFLDMEKILKRSFETMNISKKQIFWETENTFTSKLFFSHRKKDFQRNLFSIHILDNDIGL
ncbi:MAG: polyphenol oxidase family protein [Spirochaetia bacterium]|nr:polyphenol oxidase family protein [Spirochaetia bacterium]